MSIFQWICVELLSETRLSIAVIGPHHSHWLTDCIRLLSHSFTASATVNRCGHTFTAGWGGCALTVVSTTAGVHLGGVREQNSLDCNQQTSRSANCAFSLLLSFKFVFFSYLSVLPLCLFFMLFQFSLLNVLFVVCSSLFQPEHATLTVLNTILCQSITVTTNLLYFDGVE